MQKPVVYQATVTSEEKAKMIVCTGHTATEVGKPPNVIYKRKILIDTITLNWVNTYGN